MKLRKDKAISIRASKMLLDELKRLGYGHQQIFDLGLKEILRKEKIEVKISFQSQK